jgi:cell division control protein 7
MAEGGVLLNARQDISFKSDPPAPSKPRVEDETTVDSDISSSYLAVSDNEDDVPKEPVDEAVMEDMKRLEETFRGISDRFRLVNKIGEGICRRHRSMPLR